MKFGSSKALDDISVEFNAGEIHGVVGHNGAGKSTLLQILSGALSPTNGELVMGDQKLEFDEPSKALEAGIACVYQELSLPMNLPVYQCMFLGHEITSGLFTNKKKMKDESKRLCATDNVPKITFTSISKPTSAQSLFDSSFIFFLFVNSPEVIS